MSAHRNYGGFQTFQANCRLPLNGWIVKILQGECAFPQQNATFLFSGAGLGRIGLSGGQALQLLRRA